jgi:hypothetical protein
VCLIADQRINVVKSYELSVLKQFIGSENGTAKIENSFDSANIIIL